jgi:uncharacterized protein
MEIIAFGCAVAIGLIMGLTGAGGAILSVPVMVYLMGIDPLTATAYSLFIIGATSVVGTAINLKKGMVDGRTALRFAVPSLVGVWLSRNVLLPAIPDVINIGFSVLKGPMIMVFFSVMMIWAAYSLLANSTPATPKSTSRVVLIVQLFVAGIMVGLVGAGGGFLFVPMLVMVAAMPIKRAAATSLLIIAVNSAIGFGSEISRLVIDWRFLLTFSCLAITGIFFGIALNRYINESALKKGFGWFVLAMAAIILFNELNLISNFT